MPSTVSVGRFATMTHLSVKTLRHYHQVGLLEPAEIDPYTGYRYYTLDQLPTAQLIRRLRDLRMPVADVRAVLVASSPHERDTLIAAHIDHLETASAGSYASTTTGFVLGHEVVARGGIEPATFRFQVELAPTPMYFSWSDWVRRGQSDPLDHLLCRFGPILAP
jgi:DNA-binding transcriptional MerR regulator